MLQQKQGSRLISNSINNKIMDGLMRILILLLILNHNMQTYLDLYSRLAECIRLFYTTVYLKWSPVHNESTVQLLLADDNAVSTNSPKKPQDCVNWIRKTFINNEWNYVCSVYSTHLKILMTRLKKTNKKNNLYMFLHTINSFIFSHYDPDWFFF